MRLATLLSLLITLLLLLVPTVAHGATRIGTDASLDDAQTWTLAGSPVVVEGALAIRGNLRIEPGVIVKLGTGASIRIIGSLEAEGTADAPIVFTSYADDSIGGDTNEDGSATDPDQERWSTITIEQDASRAAFTNVRFSYSGAGWSAAQCGMPSTCPDAQFADVLSLSRGTLSLSDVVFDWAPGSDVGAFGGTFTGDHITFGSAYDLIHAEQYYEGPQPRITVHDSDLDRRRSVDGAIWVNLGSPILNLQRNWWGSEDGPQGEPSLRGNFWNPVDPIIDMSDWLASPDLGAPPRGSSVLFLPGLEGSRLYDSSGKLWEPFDADGSALASLLSGVGDARMRSLMIGSASSTRAYAKEDDLVARSGGTDYYASFMQSLEKLKAVGTINEWRAIAYDWRYAPEWLVTHGTDDAGVLQYEDATDTPYIEQELRALADSSKTGKVTIVAHSYGGLVAKALMEKLGGTETARLIDKVILIGVPQAGAPHTIGSMLFGYEEGISALFGLAPVVSTAQARATADTMPAGYELLPSASYFESVLDPGHPVISFAGGYATAPDAFGARITTLTAFNSFLSGEKDDRDTPAFDDTGSATLLPRALLSSAVASHEKLDAWTPPRGVHIYQVAGWGDNSTLAGIEFYQHDFGVLGAKPLFKPLTTEDGDGLVPVPSALLMSASSSRYWLDLSAYRKETGVKYDHGTELAMPEVQDLVRAFITNDGTLPRYVQTSAPSPIDRGQELLFTLRGAGTLRVTDTHGDSTGENADGSVSDAIGGSFFDVLGDLKYLLVPLHGTYLLSALGADVGAVDMETLSDGVTTSTQTVAPEGTARIEDGAIATDAPDPAPVAPDPAPVAPDLAPIDTAADQLPTGSGEPAAPVSPTLVPPPPPPSDPLNTAGSGSFGFVSPSVTIPKAPTTPKIPKKPKEKLAASAASSQTAAVLSSLPASIPASLPEQVRAVISAILAEILAILTALAQLIVRFA